MPSALAHRRTIRTAQTTIVEFHMRHRRLRSWGLAISKTGEARIERPSTLETDLHPPIKRHPERLGLEVKGEVCGCDLVALSEGLTTST